MSSDMFKHEKKVLDIVQEYLNKNRVFEIDKVLPIISDRFAKAGVNVNMDGIRIILISLIEKNLLVEGSSLTKNMILLNIKRREIYAFVTNHPGAHFSKIVRETSFNDSVVAWHLKMLVKFQFIKKEEYNMRDIYFSAEMEFESVKKIHVSSKVKSQKILYYLKENNIGLTKTQLAEALQMHPNTITKYLEELEGFNLIISDIIGNRILYFINEE